MQLTVNGDATEVPAGLSVASLLQHLGVRAARVAVEQNREIVRKADYDRTSVQDGDEIEIVTFVGGG